MESVQTQQERDRQTRLERRRQQERERCARETPEERDRRRSLRNQRDRERRRARCAAETPQERDGRLERDRQRSRERRVLLQVNLLDSSAFFKVIHHKCKLIGINCNIRHQLTQAFPFALRYTYAITIIETTPTEIYAGALWPIYSKQTDA